MIAIERLCLKFGAFELKDVSFRLERGAYGVLMGKTGTGKTSLLEAVCGLRPALSGRIELDGRDVSKLRPAERGVGYVPQDGALFPSMTVREHLGFALELRRRARDTIARRVDELAGLLGIAHLLDRSPAGLSGGEQQRVALGRALAFQPAVLCLDEPLSALDEDTRDELCELLKSVQAATGVTALHVTHSSYEARRMADKLLLLQDGRLVESDPSALRAEPPRRPNRSESPSVQEGRA
ncbi:MAG: ATP-binding cassette domain-containing protein [Planctomycetota bacterium]|nr:ATP-binding cassette domain-containing protein [Planctomycetota bacterium]